MAKQHTEMAVEKIVMELHDTKTVVLKWPDGYPSEFKTGQFITLAFPDRPKYRRAYSLSSCELDKGFFEVTVKRDGKIVGYVTSGAHSHTFGAAVGLCFIDLATGETIDTDIGSGSYSVVVEGREYAADVSLSAFYDPTNARMLA